MIALRKWLVRGLLAVLVLAALLAMAIAFALNTRAGSGWVLGQVTGRVPGELVVGAFQGTLWRGLRVRELVYRDADREVTVGGLALEIDWSAALQRRVMLPELAAETVHVHNLAPAGEAPFTLALDPVPMPVDIARARIGRVLITGAADAIDIRSVALSGAAAAGNRVTADALSLAYGDIEVAAESLEIGLGGDVPLTASLAWSLQPGAWSGRGEVRGSLAELGFDQAVDGPLPARVRGSLRLLGRVVPGFDARVTWSEWTVADLRLVSGEVALSGTADEYSAEYRWTMSGAQIEGASVTGTGTGNLQSLTEFTARLESTAGALSTSGSLAWLPDVQVQAAARVTGFDPALIHPDLSGALNAEADIGIAGDAPVEVASARVSGRLNEAEIQASGDLLLSAEQLICRACEVVAGANRIKVDGAYAGGDLALALDVRADALDVLWPGLGGRLTARGDLSGSVQSPRFTGSIEGRDLVFNDWSADSITVDSDLTGPNYQDLSMRLDTLQFGATALGNMTLEARGAPEALALQLDLAGGQFDVTAGADLALTDTGLEGAVRRAMVNEPNSGSWTLAEAAAFGLSSGELEIGAHAWRNGDAVFRVSRIASAGSEQRLAGSLQALPLELAKPFLPPNFALTGSADATVDMALRDGRWTGKVHWAQTGTVLEVRDDAGERTSIRITELALDSEFADGGARVAATLGIEPGISGRLDLAVQALDMDSAMTAKVRFEGREWDWVPAVVPEIDKFEGAITAQLDASGTPAEPALQGSLDWQDGRLLVPALNLPLEDIQVRVTGAAQGAARIAGTASAGGGRLAVEGRVDDFMRAGRSLELQLTGAAAKLLDWPDYQVWADPDLAIAVTGEGLTVNGAITVPRADIRMRELPKNAVTPSPDVRVLGEEEAPASPAVVTGAVHLVLGEQIRVSLLGLDARLEGDLQLRMPRDRPPLAEGQVTIRDGVFSAYGKELEIQDGLLTFTGPLDDPLVDVRALRTIDSIDGSVKAGIHLRGRASNLVSTVYSEPAMGEADALSYLVLGRPLSQATNAEGAELSAAALALGLGRATQITEQIGQQFGLDELSVAGDGGDATALVAGKQINSRLYARYAYGVFSRLGTLLLRYQLTDRLSLSASTSETQSVNVLYTVRKK